MTAAAKDCACVRRLMREVSRLSDRPVEMAARLMEARAVIDRMLERETKRADRDAAEHGRPLEPWPALDDLVGR